MTNTKQSRYEQHTAQVCSALAFCASNVTANGLFMFILCWLFVLSNRYESGHWCKVLTLMLVVVVVFVVVIHLVWPVLLILLLLLCLSISLSLFEELKTTTPASYIHTHTSRVVFRWLSTHYTTIQKHLNKR